MPLPKVIILFSDGNLLRDIAAIDGIAGMVGTVETVGLIGVPKVVYNLKDAESQGFTEVAEPTFHRQLKEFYAELAGNQELHIMGTAASMTMAQMLDKDVAGSATKLLLAAQGKVRQLGIFKKPAAGYDGGEDFFDSDVQAALTKSIAFGADQNAKYSYLRIVLEGRVENEDSNVKFDVKTAESKYAGVVLGGSKNDGSASVGAALGRKVRYGAEIKIGKVANGPLQLGDVYIGTKKIETLPNLEALHDLGVISFMHHPTKAGVYFGIDRMANTGDYRYWAHGSVIDKGAYLSLATYVNELESEIEVVDGAILEHALMDLESRIFQQIIAGMGDQISAVNVYINPNQDIINTNKIVITIRIQPKGYLSFIEIDLGLSAGTTAV